MNSQANNQKEIKGYFGEGEKVKNCKLRWFLYCLIVLFPFSGCATMFSGTEDVINIDSNVRGAEIIFNGQAIGQTPFSGQVPKFKNPTIVVQKEGYQTQSLIASTKINTPFIINFLFGVFGLTSTTIDTANNAHYEYSPNNYFVTLEPEGASELQLKRFEKEANLRRFILFNYYGIIQNSSSGNGEYLEALSSLLSLKSIEQKDYLASKLIEIHQDTSSPPDFAERILVLARNGSLVNYKLREN